MRKQKKLDILKRLPNGSIISVVEDEHAIMVDLDGKTIFYGWKDPDDVKALPSLEALIRALGTVYERLDMFHEQVMSDLCKDKGA